MGAGRTINFPLVVEEKNAFVVTHEEISAAASTCSLFHFDLRFRASHMPTKPPIMMRE